MNEGTYWERLRNRPVSRRTVLRGAALTGVGVAGLALVGCGDRSGSSSQGTTSRPTYGGVLKNYTDAFGTAPLDPATSTYLAASFWDYITDTGLVLSADGKIQPSLIESWEQPEPDQLILKVRSNATWHNRPPVSGRPVDGEDIATALLYHAGKLDRSGGRAVYPRREYFSAVSSVQASDPKTAVVRLTGPNNTVLPALADWRILLFPREQLDIGFTDANKLIGSGPFMADPGFPNGTDFSTTFRLTRNPNYWNEGLPYLDAVENTPNQDQAARTAAFLAGEIDILAVFRSPAAEIAELRARKPEAKFLSWEFGHWHYTRFNTQRPPWNDARVRRAIFLALNHTAMAEAFYGKEWRYSGPLPYTFYDVALSPDDIQKRPGWNRDTKEEDIKRAKDLMTAAGHPDGDLDVSVLVFGLPMNESNATILQAELKKVWPRMNVQLDVIRDATAFYAKTADLNFDLQVNTQYPSPDPVTDLITNFDTRGGRNYGKYSNTAVDGILRESLAVLDVDELREKLRQVQERLIEDMPVMVHYCANQLALVQADLSGYEDRLGPGASSVLNVGVEYLYRSQA